MRHGWLAICAFILNAQTFEIADVHPSAASQGSDVRGGFIRSARYEIHNATLADLIAAAYGIDVDRVVGGPAWLDRDRFDVMAKVPSGTTPESLKPMLQRLLADRFKVVVHNDTKLFPGYVLTDSGHRLLKQSESGGQSGCRPSEANARPAGPDAIQIWAIVCQNITMADFAERLPRIAGDYFMGERVTDRTGLSGSFDFTLRWTAHGSLALAGSDGISIYSALEKQLGVKLEVRNVTTPVVVVDAVNETATPNPSGGLQNLPAARTEFDVAAIKLSGPETKERSLRLEPSGRTELRGFTLRELIKFAFDLEDMDVIDNDELLVGAPQGLHADRFDVIASAAPPLDMDSLHLMLRALLASRFGLATHYESRPVSVYALIASKPKMKPADPTHRPACRNGLSIAASASSPLFSLDCRNTTMAQFAEKLQPFGGIYVTHPAVDSTGLKGAWDFTLRWSPPHLVKTARPAESGAAADPNAAVTIVEALNKQLGLKLRLQKRAMPVVVVDRVEQSPTNN